MENFNTFEHILMLLLIYFFLNNSESDISFQLRMKQILRFELPFQFEIVSFNQPYPFLSWTEYLLCLPVAVTLCFNSMSKDNFWLQYAY